jgi:hypothetical protein
MLENGDICENGLNVSVKPIRARKGGSEKLKTSSKKLPDSRDDADGKGGRSASGDDADAKDGRSAKNVHFNEVGSNTDTVSLTDTGSNTLPTHSSDGETNTTGTLISDNNNNVSSLLNSALWPNIGV